MLQYQFTERFEFVKTIEFKNSSPLKNIKRIRYFKEENVTGSFIKKQFRYSFDNSTWTNWNTLTQANIIAINFKDRPDFYLQVKYTRKGISTANIKGWYLYYESDVPTPPTPPSDASINADTLGGQPPEYFLNRDNHFGSFNDLQVTNVVDPSGLASGTYSTRIDTSSGTTLVFKAIKGENGITITDQSGIIIIDGSALSEDITEQLNVIDASIIELRLDLAELDSSVINLDASLNVIFGQYGNRDASIQELYIKDIIQDVSIINLRYDISSLIYDVSNLKIDTSSLIYDVSDLTYISTTQDASIVRIGVEQSAQDISILNLETISATQDASIDLLRTDISILESNIYSNNADISTLFVDTSTLRNDVSTLQSQIDTNTLDISIHEKRIDSIEASIVRIDGDVSTLFNKNIITDASLTYIHQYQIIQDASIQKLDSSLNLIYPLTLSNDASIESLTNWQIAQDASIEDLRYDISTLDTSFYRNGIDASIIELRNDISILDTSIINLEQTTIPSIEASIVRIDGDVSTLFNKTIIIDASIVELRNEVRTDISILEASIVRISEEQIIQDASIERIDDIISNLEVSIGMIDDNEVINIGDGSILIYSSRDASRNILLKTIDQIGPVFITQDNSTILIDSSIVKLYDTSLGENTFMPKDVGGFEKETSVGSLNRQTYTELIDELLFPTTDPSIIEPSFTFDISVNSFYEVDQNISVLFTITFNKGEIYVGDVLQDFRSGDPSVYYIYGHGINDASIAGGLTYQGIYNIDLSIGIHTYNAWVQYYEGPQPYNNKGSNMGSLLPDGSTSSKTTIIESTYPIYTGVTDSLITKKKLASMINGNNIELSLLPEVNGKQMFDIANWWIDASYNNRPIIGIQTFNSLGDDWEYQGGYQAASLNYWDVSSITHTVQGLTVNYTRYIYNGTDRSNTKIRLVF